ncbi:MAG: hypothetical protein IT431_02910 [Phycisphaerales bacterium]|nr:hypothetical protein [Phycisphaerales bacterium]
MGLLSGCSTRTDGPRQFTLAPGQYPGAFDATRELLRDMRFDLERVDAAAGVISTTPHFSRGVFEPWDSTQSSTTDEWEDAMNMQARAVRVSFTQDGAEPADPEAQTTAGVWVTVYRFNRSGRRLDSEWVGGSTFSLDPIQQKRYGASYLVPIRRDEALESRLADELMATLGIEPTPADAEPQTGIAPPPGAETPKPRRAGRYAW